MRVTKRPPDAGPIQTDAIFSGAVRRRTAVAEESPSLRVTAVSFERGGRTKPHVHTTDQVLIVVAGRGFLSSDAESHDLEAGDVALIPAGEKHAHGARAGEDMTHWSILGPGETTVVGE
ncbi:MAG: cupin domain-containing protein [Chloroflexi bacterium]|nr:cupin domain-containing protein [Chloroflexota bacterium]